MSDGGPHPREGLASTSEFRPLIEALPDASLIVDSRGVIVAVNVEVQRLLGYAPDELIGKSVELLVPQSVRAAHAAYRAGYMAAPAKRPMGIGRELFARRRDGSDVPVEIGLSPLLRDEGRFVLAVIHDIRQRRRLRAFGAGVLQGAEEERQRIARELHDDTAQTLAALVLRLQMARRSPDPETRDRLLKELHDEIHRAAAGVRRILRGLRPPLLDDSGLVAALRSNVKSMLAETRLEYSLETVELEHLLSRDAKLALYRILQEAVSNVIRHARASSITIRLGVEEDEGVVRLEVEDDGIGFEPERMEPAAGRRLGIVGMIERAAILGGTAHIESAPGRGTRVRVSVPVVSPL